MSQVLLNGQQKVLPGRFFHSQEDVQMPWPFFFVRHRVRLSSGKGKEIDLLGAAAGEVWIGQSKWVTRDKIGIDALQNLATQAELVKEEMGDRKIRKWLFAYSSLTREAEQFAQKHDILWSSHEELNALLSHLGLRELPDFEPE